MLAAECSIHAIVDAVREGRCYASTGVYIETIHVDDVAVTIDTANAARLSAIVDGQPAPQISSAACVTFEVPPDATYIRFECVADDDCWPDTDGTPSHPEHVVCRAWTQPMWVLR